MSKFSLVLFLVLVALTATGQTVSHEIHKSFHRPKPHVIDSRESQETCFYTNLSKSLLFKTRLEPFRVLIGKKDYDSCQIKITVLTKLSRRVVFTTKFLSGFLYNAYQQPNTGRSYTTGTGQDADIKDYDYGDLVIADFNFDGKEDFAAKNDSGGNRGPTYNFYLQNGAGSFVLDIFLTEQMGHFPDQIDKPAKTLLLESNNGRWYFKNSYRLDTKSGKWQETKRAGTYKSQ